MLRERTLLRDVATLVAIGAIYYVSARLSLTLSLVGESVTPLWPPTGIALVAILILGYRIWPAITIAAFLVNLPIGPSARTAIEIAVGNTAAPVFAAALLRLVSFRSELDRTRDAVALVALAALFATTVSATVGALALDEAGALEAGSFWPTWLVWWAGDAMGILAVAPLLLSYRHVRPSWPRSWIRVIEGVLLFASLGAVSALLSFTARPVWVGVFPLLVLIAWRYQQRGASPAALLVIGAASWAAAHNSGPFAGPPLGPKMLSLQVFNAAVALTSFFFAAVVAERSAARRDLERSALDLYEREHRIAETLQHSFLPDEIPQIPDLAIAARYIPAADDVEVGGDWYDIITLPGGSIGLVVGDVAGHGVAAAASMGQIRMALRAYALEGLPPARALERLNTLLTQLHPGAMATLAYGHLDPDTGILVLAKAGHPPPLLVPALGGSTFVTGGLGPPLGALRAARYEEVTLSIPADATLLLYTDGLIERRGESIDAGFDRLAAATASAPEGLDATSDHLLASLLGDGATDDVAMLMIRRIPLAGRGFQFLLPAEPKRLADLRRSLRRWLRSHDVDTGTGEEVVLACGEAVANAIQHAYGSREGSVHVDANIAGEVLTLTVRDFGTWRSPRAVPRDDSGKGTELMRVLMTSIDVLSDTDGTEVTMTRDLRRPSHG
jgi:serine phosphatase RsbU (regulator of sigma subunit)/integral membrane sensor domain MASE1/anti-sigma regulatory factor (Ser/Thr protein kinase)